MKYRVLILFAFLVSACAEDNLKNISTDEASRKYGNLISNKLFFAFPEVRENPLKWFDSIPEVKLKKSTRPGSFVLTARPGEIFILQTGIWALNGDVSDVQLEISDFIGRRGSVINASRTTCYNLGGTDFRGNTFKKQVNIPKGRVQAFWIGIDLDSIRSGTYKGSVSVVAGGERQIIPLSIKVSGDPVSNHGYDEGSHLSRLNWLNSTVGTDDQVTKGYTPVEAKGNRISILGRAVEIGATGLPESVQSFFGPSNQSLSEKGEPLLSRPVRFIIEKMDGTIEKLHPRELVFTEKTPLRASWKVINASADFNLEVSGTIEFDGFCDFSLKLTSKDLVKIRDIRLEIPVEKRKAEYDGSWP